jgi:uncharacterized protein (TIGR03067 family)
MRYHQRAAMERPNLERSRTMVSALMTSLLFLAAQAPANPQPLQGTWKITALIEDGKSLTDKEIATEFVADGQFVIDGNVVSMLPPGQFNRRTLIYTTGEEKGNKTLDLAGTAKGDSKGIYSLSGDTMLLCIGKTRPTDFNADAATGNVLIALKRVGEVPPKAKPVAAPAPADMATKLVGTWGHQDDKAIYYYTLNQDGSFSATQDWKKGLKKLFDLDIHTSGTWKLEGDTIVVRVTQSNDEHRKGQIYSYKVTTLAKDELITVDQYGNAKREWRVR